MKHIVIQGASRGIGLALCKSLQHAPGVSVIATCRNPGDFPLSLPCVKLDVTDFARIPDAASEIEEISGGKHLHGLINVTGILIPEKNSKQLTGEDLTQVLNTNLVGPMLFTKSIVPLISPAKCEFSTTPFVSFLSAKVGSISDNKIGGWYSYRISKAAVNQFMRTLSVELRPKRIATCSLHPGTVETDLSKSHLSLVKHRVYSADECAENLLTVIRGLSMDKTGTFFNYAGEELPF